jgi:hypothetical protein
MILKMSQCALGTPRSVGKMGCPLILASTSKLLPPNDSGPGQDQIHLYIMPLCREDFCDLFIQCDAAFDSP